MERAILSEEESENERAARAPKRVPGKMYRAERHDFHLGVQVGVELDAAIEAVGQAELMRPSECLRLLLIEGLKAWRADDLAAQLIEEGAVPVLRGVAITEELQAALVEESRRLRVSQSLFVRRMLVEGIKAWRKARVGKGGARDVPDKGAR